MIYSVPLLIIETFRLPLFSFNKKLALVGSFWMIGVFDYKSHRNSVSMVIRHILGCDFWCSSPHTAGSVGFNCMPYTQYTYAFSSPLWCPWSCWVIFALLCVIVPYIEKISGAFFLTQGVFFSAHVKNCIQ